jgi:hypothetical protein
MEIIPYGFKSYMPTSSLAFGGMLAGLTASDSVCYRS